MRKVARLFRFVFVTHRSFTALLSLLVVSLIISFATGFWLTARLANVIILIFPVAFVWSWFNLRGLKVDVERPVDRMQVGNYFEERITIANRGWFTKLWLEVEDLSELPGHAPRRVISLGPRAERSWRAATLCTRRGLYNVGPLQITTTDIFGMFRRTRMFGMPQAVLVYPRAVDLPNFSVPSAQLPGEGRYRHPTQQITPNASGVREYQPGDSLNRFHWRSTARTGQLMVKIFDLDPASDIWVLLDLHADVQSGAGDDSTEEHAVRIAASVCRYFLAGTRSVGFMAFGRKMHLEEPERGLPQYTRILEQLAIGRAQGDVPLSELLNHEGRRFGRHTTLVVITPSTDESWIDSLQMLAGQGTKLAAIVLEPGTFGGSDGSLLVYSALAASDVTTYLVKRTDDLGMALGASAAAAVGERV